MWRPSSLYILRGKEQDLPLLKVLSHRLGGVVSRTRRPARCIFHTCTDLSSQKSALLVVDDRGETVLSISRLVAQHVRSLRPGGVPRCNMRPIVIKPSSLPPFLTDILTQCRSGPMPSVMACAKPHIKKTRDSG